MGNKRFKFLMQKILDKGSFTHPNFYEVMKMLYIDDKRVDTMCFSETYGVFELDKWLLEDLYKETIRYNDYYKNKILEATFIRFDDIKTLENFCYLYDVCDSFAILVTAAAIDVAYEGFDEDYTLDDLMDVYFGYFYGHEIFESNMIVNLKDRLGKQYNSYTKNQS